MGKNVWKIRLLIVAGLLLLSGCGQKDNSDNEKLYGNKIASLGDQEQFALVDIGEKNDVLFITDLTFEDGNGHNEALYSDVYYAVDKEVYDLGRVESMGTAYPLSYGEKSIYTASENSLEVYGIDEETHQLSLKTQYQAIYDEEGNASYRCIEDGKEKDISEEDYLAAFKRYEQSTVINFGYGAAA